MSSPTSVIQIVIPALIAFLVIGRFRETLLLPLYVSKGLKSSPSLKQENGEIARQDNSGDGRSLGQLKEMYHKLQNLEDYPEILPKARDTLILLFSEALESLSAKVSSKSGILAIEQYNKEKLAVFMHNEQDKVTKNWEDYVIRRRSGSPRELLRDRESAKHWIKQISPLKYVDGAWLGHINKSATPFALREITKDAWQILSEEYGDGDPKKHHVNVYHELVQAVDSTLPKGDTTDFIHPRHELDEIPIWKAAVAQLLISLFPHDFLPEILGFNLHFEGLSEETLIASKELQELKYDPYYFSLHICIDNADSGHTAMALRIVVNYLELIRRTNGDETVQRLWKGIQAGFMLSQSLSAAACHLPRSAPDADQILCKEHESALARIFQSKAFAAHRVHCDSKMKVGRRTLNEWLDPNAMSSICWQLEFLHDLSNAKHLVRRGESSRSRIMQEISWRGRMFGSFTEDEVEIVRKWIDSLPPLDQIYWKFVGQPQPPSAKVYQREDIPIDHIVLQTHLPSTEVSQRQNIRVEYSAGQAEAADTFSTKVLVHPRLHLTNSSAVRGESGNIDVKRLLPLWFAHPTLLESFVAIPWKTGTAFGCSVIRFLRAQGGFNIEGSGVAGIQECDKVAAMGLIELGLEIVRSQGLRKPISLKEALEEWPSDFARTMLHISMRPVENAETLLGLAWAFVDLHETIASSPILSAPSQVSLQQIAKRERENLKRCMRELECEDFRNAKFQTAYNRGRLEIDSCFR
ncbi:MAG: hypothetical protein MMC33_007573 [Icmadophila ericetorum]|nr:hypothetical protein [Icmadophila ericetorum]